MIVKRSSTNNVWLILLLLVLASNFVLYRSSFGLSLLPAEANGVVIGSLIDFTIVAPLLFLAWQRKVTWKISISLIAGGLIAARFIIPIEYLAPFKTFTLLGFVMEGALIALEILLVVTLFRYFPTIIRTVKKSSLPLLFSFSQTVDKKVKKHPLIQVICAELLMFYYAFGTWKKTPIDQSNTFTLHKNSSLIAFYVLLIHAMIVESIVVHWLLHGKSFILSLILLVTNIYSIILLLGNIQAVRFNPLQIAEDRMYISLGLMKRMEIRWEDIERVIDDREVLERKLSKKTIDFVARDFEKVYPDIILKLNAPVKATLLMGIPKKFEEVAIRVDNPQKFKVLLQEKLSQ